MNDEIKEILDNFKDYELRYKQCNENQFIIFYKDIHLLLDYITNLQNTKEYLGEVLHEQDLELEDYKSRIEKAVEYIKNCPEYLWANVNTKVLLNILNGKGSDE